ncbi:MAG: hypothetical protein JNK82_21245 [Myxococcaceae bacterium]|nr:hypothetical protein [Myxococcaceae bacterium]
MFSPELGILKIASPCSQKWSKMTGDDRVRFCGKCQLKVYDFTQMETEEVRTLLRTHEGRRVCARFYRRRDGRVMTRDCPRPDGAWLNRFLMAGGTVGLVAAVLLAVITFFGDHIRSYYGMSAGALAGDDTVAARPPDPTHHTLKNFGDTSTY